MASNIAAYKADTSPRSGKLHRPSGVRPQKKNDASTRSGKGSSFFGKWSLKKCSFLDGFTIRFYRYLRSNLCDILRHRHIEPFSLTIHPENLQNIVQNIAIVIQCWSKILWAMHDTGLMLSTTQGTVSPETYLVNREPFHPKRLVFLFFSKNHRVIF